jgi:hypothetical protein
MGIQNSKNVTVRNYTPRHATPRKNKENLVENLRPSEALDSADL